MSYIFGKLWHSAIIWPIRKSFQCILQGVIFLLAKQTRLSGTSDNESYIVESPMRRMKVWNMWHYDQASLSSGDNMCAVSEKENLAIWWPSLLAGGFHLAAALSSPTIMSPTNRSPYCTEPNQIAVASAAPLHTAQYRYMEYIESNHTDTIQIFFSIVLSLLQ